MKSREIETTDGRKTEYLIGTPLLADYLERRSMPLDTRLELTRRVAFRGGLCGGGHAYGQGIFDRPIAEASSARKA
jgi:hypothetical protein